MPRVRVAILTVIAFVFLGPGIDAQPRAALKIVVIEGEGAVNIIQQKTAVAPIVEVRDENELPVAGALVTFSVRSGGATFGGAPTWTVTTNAAGRAVAAGLTPTANGAVSITASAAYQGQTAIASILQSNVLTAAEAAAASGATAGTGTGAAPTTGAAGGGGGGVSGTTLGLAGAAAAAAGVIAVTGDKPGEVAPGPPRDTSRVLTGRYQGVLAEGFGVCANVFALDGLIRVTLITNADTIVSASAVIDENRVGTETSCPYRDFLNMPFQMRPPSVPLQGLPAVNFSTEMQTTYATPTNSGTADHTWRFSGSLQGQEITGTLTVQIVNNGLTPSVTPALGRGVTEFSVTLR